jgi:hypothetical protein
MSGAQGLRLVQGSREEGCRQAVLERVRTRWGEAAAERARDRVRRGTASEVEAWHRRAAYFPDPEGMLDLSRKLAVSTLSVKAMLDCVSGRSVGSRSFVFLEFWSSSRWEPDLAERDVPWLADVRDAQRALGHLCSQGWVLLGCEEPGQGRELWKHVRRRGSVRPSVYDLGGHA